MTHSKVLFIKSLILITALAFFAPAVKGGDLIIHLDTVSPDASGSSGGDDDDPGLRSNEPPAEKRTDRSLIDGASEIIHTFSGYMDVERITVEDVDAPEKPAQTFVRGWLNQERFPTCDPCTTAWIEVPNPDRQALLLQLVERQLPTQLSGPTSKNFYIGMLLIELPAGTVVTGEKVWVDPPV